MILIEISSRKCSHSCLSKSGQSFMKNSMRKMLSNSSLKLKNVSSSSNLKLNNQLCFWLTVEDMKVGKEN
jgi:hypothetical protein